MKGKGSIDEALNKHLNEDAISQGRCGDVVVFYNINNNRLKEMCIKDKLEGSFIGLRIDNITANEANCQGMKNWKPGEYLIMPGDNKKYHFVLIPQIMP
jgi:hypothetical protein